MGDSHRELAEAANRFFLEWHQLLCSLFVEARDKGKIRPDTDIPGLSRLVMSALEGGILICKASKDKNNLLETIEMIKTVIAGYKI